MARKVFFSFHYKPDNWRASQVRNIGKVEGNNPASDNDWETVTKGGSFAGKPSCTATRRYFMAKKRVFVSFDFDNDKTLKDFIIGQARLPDSPFEVADHSLKEAQPQRDWEAKARRAISRAEVFIVMLGPSTRRASGVLKEVKMANDLMKSRFQIIGYTDGTADWAVPGGGRTYRWNWANLKKLLS